MHSSAVPNTGNWHRFNKTKRRVSFGCLPPTPRRLNRMDATPRIELTWTEGPGRDEPEPCLRFETLDDVQRDTITYVVVFRVCATPRCPCHSVCAHCSVALSDGTASSGPLRWFWIDVRRRTLEMTSALKADLVTRRLAELILTRLSETAWEDLLRWFWTAKIQAIETAEVSEIDIADLPDADAGRMIPFVEVFPLGLSLNFTFAQADWAADEQYCVQPGCDCTGLVLSFLQLRDAAGRTTKSLRDVPAVRYDYRSQASCELAPGSAGTPPTAQLLGALRTAYPSLDTRLELHHRMMQSLYARQYLARAKFQNERLENQLPTRAEKVGRNDLCPCGSGKKFKRCCGAGSNPRSAPC